MADTGDGGLTLLQGAVAIGTILGAALAGFLSAKGKARLSGENVEWFFDGPVVKALDILQGIYRENAEGRREQREAADETNKRLDKQIDILNDIRNCVTRERPPRR
jgi:hypothetical protein